MTIKRVKHTVAQVADVTISGDAVREAYGGRVAPAIYALAEGALTSDFDEPQLLKDLVLADGDILRVVVTVARATEV